MHYIKLVHINAKINDSYGSWSLFCFLESSAKSSVVLDRGQSVGPIKDRRTGRRTSP